MRHKDIEVDKTDPFANCKLDRRHYANALTSIIKAYHDGFVLAVNGKWGTGKTTFMKMWKQVLQNEGYKTILFNAWENDFASEPMIAILGEIKSIISKKSEKKFEAIINKAYKFSTTVLPTLAKTTATLAGFGQLSEVAEKLSDATVKAFNDEISEYDKKKNSLEELKKDLSEFVKENCDNKPLIFIVDELDRCCPNYAVAILEKIKHFFSVDGIVFVLSIDKEQLGNSIRGYYGSDLIEADEYLRRFIDLEYTLPEPEYKDYCRFLYDSTEFDQFFKSPTRVKYNFNGEDESLLKIACTVVSAKGLSLRQIEKLFIHTRLVTRIFDENNYVYPDSLFLLVYLKSYHADMYIKIKNKRLNIQELVSGLETIFDVNIKQEKDERYSQSFHYAVARILLFYENMFPNKESMQLISRIDDNSGKVELSFETSIFNKEKLFNAIKYLKERIHEYEIRITYFTEKIDLLDNLKN